MIAARTATSSLTTPLANEATRLARARSIHEARPASALRLTIMWNSATISRPSTKVGTPASIAATVAASSALRKAVRDASDSSALPRRLRSF